ncbi:MAG: HAD hydrolase-like protein [Roseibacillus sp.]
MHGRLVLFDIDGTLIDTRGAGLKAIRMAVHDLHGAEVPKLDLNGATDSGLARDILSSFDLEVNEKSVSAFYEAYLVRLAEHLGNGDFAGVILPGVPRLLDALREAGATLGLLTGNIAAGADLKLEHFGLAEYFGFGAFGDDHHDRNELGPVAVARAEEMQGRSFDRAETVIIGDTPKDIACGKALGSITLAVATGSFTVEELRDHHATMVVENFDDPVRIVSRLRRYPHKGN